MVYSSYTFPDQFFFPPGYMTTKSFRNFIGALKKGQVKPQAELSYDELLRDRYIIVGSPETVKNQLGEYCDTVGAGGMIGAGSPFGPMPNWMVMKNMQMYAEEIIPAFREADGLPDYLRSAAPSPRSHAELAARHGAPVESARSIVTGANGLIEHKFAHVAEVIDPTMSGQAAEQAASAG